MEKERYNGWRNYATWRVNLECFDGWQGDELNPEAAEEYVTEHIYETSEDGIARDYALAFIAQVDWTEITLAHCPPYSYLWREQFTKAFIEAAPQGFDSEADAQTDSPWQAPWEWEDYSEWALDEDPVIAAQKYAKIVYSELEALAEDERELENNEGGTL